MKAAPTLDDIPPSRIRTPITIMIMGPFFEGISSNAITEVTPDIAKV